MAVMQCPNCLLDLGVHPGLKEGSGDILCPNCGYKQEAGKLEPASPEAAASDATFNLVSSTKSDPYPVSQGGILAHFFNALRDIIFRPQIFFSSKAMDLIEKPNLSHALAFALVVHWIAAFFNFLYRSVAGVMLESRFNDLFQIAVDIVEVQPYMSENMDLLKEKMIKFLFGANSVVVTPFTTLIKLSLGALLVHAAIRLFTRDSPERPHRYTTTLKILSYASAPWVLCIIPTVGVVLAWLLSFIAAAIGLREVYRTTTSRAVLAALFPELLFLGLLLIGMFFLLFLALNLLRLLF